MAALLPPVTRLCFCVKGNHGLFSHVRSLPARTFW